MQFNIEESLKILERTPLLLDTLLTNLDEEWISGNEGENTWSPFDVVGHLIHGEKTDWVPRMMIILGEQDDKRFVPFDRFAQFDQSKGKSLTELLDEFRTLRRENLLKTKQVIFTEEVLHRKGIHPEFDEITLKQLLATWVVHDLAHLCQITRVMAKQYGQEIGPWVKYFSIFDKV